MSIEGGTEFGVGESMEGDGAALYVQAEQAMAERLNDYDGENRVAAEKLLLINQLATELACPSAEAISE